MGALTGTLTSTSVLAMLLLAWAMVAGAALATRTTSEAQAAVPAGQGFTLNSGDMKFILKQIKIGEAHATTESGPGAPLVGSGPNQIPTPLVAYGLRTVDGSENNLQPGQDSFGASDQLEPRLANPFFREAEAPLFGPGTTTTYASKTGSVTDSQPRVISNLIVDQTSANPAAVQAAGFPNRAFSGKPTVPCTTEPDPAATPPVDGVPAGCTPKFKTLFIPNVTTDVGLSPPYNSWFTYFGQFFDHGLDFTEKAGGKVYVPLKPDDPLISGPDHVLGNADDLPPAQRFMLITRTKNQPGPDGVLGTDDDIQEARNTDTPWVDQSQTYASSPSQQVFLRDYELNAAGKPVSTGGLLKGPDGGMATWKTLKDQAATMLGIRLIDNDVFSVPLLATDEYGRFLRGPNGMPQMVTAGGLVEGDLGAPVSVPADAKHAKQAFLDDINNNATPKSRTGPLTPDTDTTITPASGTQDPGTYDDEMLDRHFVAGDGRVNENIGLTAVHQIFHSEHNRLTGYMKKLIIDDPALDPADWQLADGSWNGERLFQAARYVNEMEYQHLVFEEFARKIQPAIDPFNPGHQNQSNINPAIKAEFASAVYRFGHSMLNDTIARTNVDGSKNDISLLKGFLNPPAYNEGGSAGTLTPDEAAGSIIAGETDQVGNELDEFTADTLRNNLLGLPLDLPAINMTRARDAGIPPLNDFRRQLYASTGDGSLRPYTDWVDFGLSLKHQYSVVNFMAAYGQHPTIKAADTIVGKRRAAQRIFDNDPSDPNTPSDSAEFVNGTGTWVNSNGKSTTGLEDVDLWVGGLAEAQNQFGGLLGSTFNYVFETQLTDLQNGDRLYYLRRTEGLNLRTQLEGNSFAELIGRNTPAKSLKADVFATADCEFELANLQGTTPGTIADDPASDCDESKLLVRMGDGTIRYRLTNSVDPSGINSQSTYMGTSGDDKVFGGVDTDTFWGNEGNDRIEGNDGADVALGGVGDDIISDLNGDDDLKGGDGNDAIEAGPGLDLLQPGFGDDFTDGGLNNNSTFAGEGNDTVISGNGTDTVFGGGGDDWVEGGNGNDLLQGDSGAPFFDDVNAPGNDVISGDGGDDDYDAEGGDDIMVAGPGRERNAGILGFDWVTHARDPQAADSDLTRPIALLPAPAVNDIDRFTNVEALSGWKFDDTLRGGSAPPPAGNDLDAAGIARIAGLQAVVGPGVTSFSGDRNIILGGAGNDLIEGRGGDDVIDGDKWLNVQLRAPDPSTPDTTDTKLVDSATELRADVMAGRINPGDVKAVRSIESTPGTNDIDTAQFSGPRSNYTITPNLNRTEMTVTQTGANVVGQTVSDGTDTVRNVEKLRFSDVIVDVATGTTAPAPPAGTPPGGTPDPAPGTPPAGGGTPPAGGGTPPAGGGTPPAGGGTPPAGGGTPPAGGGTPPAGGGTPPAGGGTPPAGGGTVLDIVPALSQAITQTLTGSGTLQAAVPLIAGRLRALVMPGAGGLTVIADVPTTTRVVQIRVFRLGAPGTRRTPITTVLRRTTSAKRHTFRLREKRLRHLKRGRYLVEVRLGSRVATLGPATTKTVRVFTRG